MTEHFLPFAKPSFGEEEINEVIACLKSGWITTGPRVKQFETQLKDYLQTPYVSTLTSATAGLQLALMTLQLQPGDEVITTALTFAATLNTIVQAGGKPVLVDIDATYNIDINKIEAAITQKTRAIMPVHFAGLAADLDPIYALAKKHNLRVIEDCAQAIGAYYKGNILGSFGDIQVFSFHPNKNMTTGEGGCVTVRSPQELQTINALKFHGIDRDASNRFSKTGSQLYDVVTAGYKYNMMDLQAAIGIHQLPKLDNFINKRTQLVKNYYAAFANWPEITLPQLPSYDNKHSWHLFTVLINSEITGFGRDDFMQHMKDKDIGTGLHYQPVHLFSYYQQQFGYRPGDFPIAENICSRIVSLPLFPDMTEVDQQRVIATMAEIFKK